MSHTITPEETRQQAQLGRRIVVLTDRPGEVEPRSVVLTLADEADVLRWMTRHHDYHLVHFAVDLAIARDVYRHFPVLVSAPEYPKELEKYLTCGIEQRNKYEANQPNNSFIYELLAAPDYARRLHDRSDWDVASDIACSQDYSVSADSEVAGEE